MKKLFAVLALTCAGLIGSAQSVVTTVKFQKADRVAVENELPFPEKTIMQAVVNKLEAMGYKATDSKGFTIFKGVKLAELGPGEYDLYFMAERKSWRNKDNSTLTLMISKGFEKFLTIKEDATLITQAQTYLEHILPLVEAHDHELQIVAQQEAVTKADKKYTSLVDEAQSLEKKKRSIEKDIEDNKTNQEKQLGEIEKQKQILQTLLSTRKQ